MKSVLITGVTGFVGRYLCAYLLQKRWAVRGTSSAFDNPATFINNIVLETIGSLGPDTQWGHALYNIDTIIHLAARVHVMNDPIGDLLAEYRLVNVAGTERLAREAAKAGVKRFVFISSVKVNGEEAPASYTSDSLPQPFECYGVSKWEAEQVLRCVEEETGLEVVIVRPTLVYGPGVKANFLNMMKAVQRGIPLPFASIDNKRSLIYVGNLADALAVCAMHPAAAGKTYLVSDGEDVSTPELIRRVASAMDMPARLFACSPSLLRLAGTVTGRGAAVNRLLGSLTVDSSMIRQDLGWLPPFTMDEGLRETARWFKENGR